jgi:hypothetical protein
MTEAPNVSAIADRLVVPDGWAFSHLEVQATTNGVPCHLRIGGGLAVRLHLQVRECH